MILLCEQSGELSMFSSGPEIQQSALEMDGYLTPASVGDNRDNRDYPRMNKTSADMSTRPGNTK